LAEENEWGLCIQTNLMTYYFVIELRIKPCYIGRNQ